MSSEIINHLKNIQECSYLELGVRDNINFDKINAQTKVSVDINGDAMFNGTTDEYFASLTPDTKFNIVFIDACHDYEYVLRDFNNSVDHAIDWILLHDMIPPSLKYTASKFCSDSYKILYYLLKEQQFEIYPMNNNFGFTLIRMPASKIYPAESYANTSYAEFAEYIETVKLYSDEEIIRLLKDQNV
jgi:hypothetical protein